MSGALKAAECVWSRASHTGEAWRESRQERRLSPDQEVPRNDSEELGF